MRHESNGQFFFYLGPCWILCRLSGCWSRFEHFWNIFVSVCTACKFSEKVRFRRWDESQAAAFIRSGKGEEEKEAWAGDKGVGRRRWRHLLGDETSRLVNCIRTKCETHSVRSADFRRVGGRLLWRHLSENTVEPGVGKGVGRRRWRHLLGDETSQLANCIRTKCETHSARSADFRRVGGRLLGGVIYRRTSSNRPYSDFWAKEEEEEEAEEAEWLDFGFRWCKTRSRHKHHGKGETRFGCFPLLEIVAVGSAASSVRAVSVNSRS